jgi:predicted transcriptional regulator of viral defense system
MPKTADVRAVGELAASRHGVFTSSQAAEFGISRNDVARLERDGLIERIRPSVWRFAGVPTGWRQTLYGSSVGRRVAASHFTAAALHVVDGLESPPVVAEFLCHHDARVFVNGAKVRRTRCLPRQDVMELDGIACTTLARTACDLAALVEPVQLVRIVDDIQRRGSSMRWLLQRALYLQTPGRSGPAELIDVVRPQLPPG